MHVKFLILSKTGLFFKTCYCPFFCEQTLCGSLTLQDTHATFSAFAVHFQAIICLSYLHDCSLKNSISLEQYKYHSKTSSSKQKHCITNWLKRSEIQKGKEIEEGPLPVLPENE